MINKSRILQLVLSACLAVCVMSFAGDDDGGGWADLLSDMSGWRHFSEKPGTALTDVWVMTNGVLICRGTPRGYLVLQEKVADFELKFEWKRPEGVKPGKAGVLMRMSGPDRIWPKSLEAQLNAGAAGDFWGLGGFELEGPTDRKKVVDNPQQGRLTNLKRTSDHEKPVGEWNIYEIIARGQEVTLRINGVEVNRATKCDQVAGPLCLTAEGDEIHFRNVRLRRFGDLLASECKTVTACPSPAQYAWHEQERIMFVHFGVASWENSEYDADGKTDLSKMNPAGFSGDSLCEVAKSWGARQVLLVAKHVGGFCWWPTKTTDYCTRSIPWRDGKGNLVKEVADACRRHGLSIGIYLYPDDTRFTKAIGRSGKTDDPSKQEEWNRLFRQQWEEVLSICGTDLVREVWLDGGCAIELGDILKRHAPNAVVFQGRNASIRWVGNEAGVARDPNWNTLRKSLLESGVATQEHSDQNGDVWAPVECDTPLYAHNWFWAPRNEAKKKSLFHLISVYIQSAGRGSIMLLNSTPNTDGCIPESDKERYRELGEAIECNFGHPIAIITNIAACEAELDLGNVHQVNCADLWEDYQMGHRIRAYLVEGRVNGAWTNLVQGTAVGRRKLDLFDPVAVDRIRVRITKNVGMPRVRRFQVHKIDDMLLQPTNQVHIINRWRKACEWEGGLEVRADLTAAVTRADQYEVRFLTAANKPVVVKNAVLLFEGSEADQVFLSGVGTDTLIINRTQAIGEGAATAIRATLNVPEGSKGVVQIRLKN